MYAVHSLEQVHVCSTLSGTSLCMQYTLWNKSMYPNNQLHREMFIFCQSMGLSQVRLCKSFVLDNGLFHVIKKFEKFNPLAASRVHDDFCCAIK